MEVCSGHRDTHHIEFILRGMKPRPPVPTAQSEVGMYKPLCIIHMSMQSNGTASGRMDVFPSCQTERWQVRLPSSFRPSSWVVRTILYISLLPQHQRVMVDTDCVLLTHNFCQSSQRVSRKAHISRTNNDTSKLEPAVLQVGL